MTPVFHRVRTSETNFASDALLVHFIRGVAPGGWDGAHGSAIAADDASANRVLIRQVDQKWDIRY